MKYGLAVFGASVMLAAVIALSLGLSRLRSPVIPQAAQAPPHVIAFAEAQCHRDPAGLVANAADLTIEAATPAIAQAAKCSTARYLGTVHMENGPHYIFVLTDADDEYEMWWVYSVDAISGLVTGVR